MPINKLIIFFVILFVMAVAQEVRAGNRKVAGSIPGLRLAKCGGVPEEGTT